MRLDLACLLMNKPALLTHGNYIHPAYRIRKGKDISWAGKSVDAERPDGQVSGIVKRYQKLEVACDKVMSLGTKILWRNAICDDSTGNHCLAHVVFHRAGAVDDAYP